ncbi:uncharacterized protein [Dermacentor andersoni]|uniref:uncharacterized protein n=1 Tax=Dermacentor andersoni TaxID=34620 RepID=UPI002417CA1F|nr:uncharacterized protein LOC126540095 [Dermacentor andersoni]
MGSASGKAFLLAVERSVLRSSRLQPNAVARGLVQKVVDMNAHGIALSDSLISEADTRAVAQDAKILSEEIQPYHGLIRYDTFLGNRSALRTLMLDVISKPSMTFVYRVSGISRTFTHLYFDNFYSTKLNERNLLCALPPAYIQCLQYSIMTRHYDTGDHVSEDVFFEVESTFTAKVRLILQQLTRAGTSPVAFILERYDKEAQQALTYYNPNLSADVACAATPFGFTSGVKAELANL